MTTTNGYQKILAEIVKREFQIAAQLDVTQVAFEEGEIIRIDSGEGLYARTWRGSSDDDHFVFHGPVGECVYFNIPADWTRVCHHAAEGERADSEPLTREDLEVLNDMADRGFDGDVYLSMLAQDRRDAVIVYQRVRKSMRSGSGG